MPHPLSGTVERRLSGAVAGRRDSGTAGPGSRRGSSALAGRVEAAREQRTRLLSLSKSSMKGSFDIQSFLDEKDLDIAGRIVDQHISKFTNIFIAAKSYKDMFPVANGAEAEDTTSKFLYAVVEILLDFVNQTNDRDSVVLVNC